MYDSHRVANNESLLLNKSSIRRRGGLGDRRHEAYDFNTIFPMLLCCHDPRMRQTV
jgi:hypothetical protein